MSALTIDLNFLMSKLTIVYLPISKLSSAKYCRRFSIEQANLNELEELVISDGDVIKNPLRVCPGDNGNFDVIKGTRRLEVAKRRSIGEVPCIVVPGIHDEMNSYLDALGASATVKTNPIEDALVFNRLYTEYNLSQADIAVAAGLGREGRVTVNRYIRLLDLAKPVQELIASHELPYAQGLFLLKLRDEISQYEVALYAIKNNLTQKQLEHYIESILNPVTPAPTKGNDSYKEEISIIQPLLQKAFKTDIKIKEKNEGLEFTFNCRDPESLKTFMERVQFFMDSLPATESVDSPT